MAHGKPKPRWKQFHVSVGLFGLLQRPMGGSTPLCLISRICRHERSIYGTQQIHCGKLGDAAKREGGKEALRAGVASWKRYPIIAIFWKWEGFEKFS